MRRALLVLVLLAVPAWAETVSLELKKDTRDERTIGRARIARNLIQESLEDWPFATVYGERRAAMLRAAIGSLKDEAVVASGTGYRLSYSVARDAKARVIRALDLEGRHPGLSVAVVSTSSDELAGIVAAGTASGLASRGFKVVGSFQREATTVDALEKVAKDAGATLLVLVEAHVRRDAVKLRAALEATLFFPELKAFVAWCPVESSPTWGSTEAEATSRPEWRLHEPPAIGGGAELVRYASFAGRVIGREVALAIFEGVFPRGCQVDDSPPPSRVCPGCSTSIIEPDVLECPLCESPLPAPLQPKLGEAKPYTLRFKGWSENELLNIQDAILDDRRWTNWKMRGLENGFEVVTVLFSGDLVIRRINEALDAIDLRKRAKVNKTGDVISIIKQ